MISIPHLLQSVTTDRQISNFDSTIIPKAFVEAPPMQLIHRKTLAYQAGSSDKVYEVDLCQLAVDRYIVNYRFGRRGGTLKEGCQTPSALDLAGAQKAFDKLVNSKLAKGYQEAKAAVVAPPKAAAPVFTLDLAGRDRAILDRLSAAVAAPNQPDLPKQWPLDRVIWRSGELQLTAAAPLLIQLWSDRPIRNYSIAWALGNCGDVQSIPLLEQAYRDRNNPDRVRRISLAAILRLDQNQRAKLRPELIAQLPAEIRMVVENNDGIELVDRAVTDYLTNVDLQQISVVGLLYQIDPELGRKVIVHLLETADFKPNCFKHLRHTFKLAEYYDDAELLAAFTYWFDRNKAAYGGGYRWIWLEQERQGRENSILIGGGSEQDKLELSSADSRLAYGVATRDYLRRRIWRSLKTMGASARPEYTKIATAILLQYDDTHAAPVRESVIHSDYNNRTYRYNKSITVRWDTYAAHLTFNHLLYTHSPRYQLKSGKDIWQCKPNYKPGDPIATIREEAFPELWNQQPELLLKLLSDSNCQPVHEFAVKAIADSPEFCQALSIETIVQLLTKPYAVTAQFGFELARSRYDAQNPQSALILAIANCAYAPARTEAYAWLNAQLDRFLTDEVLIAGLVLSPQSDTQIFIRQTLSTTIIPTHLAQNLIARIVAGLLALTDEQSEIAEQGTQTLTTCFQVQLRSIGLAIILDLLRHPLAILQTTGARILLDRQTPAIDLPPGLIDALIDSPIDSVRSIGVQLFAQLPDPMLIDQLELIFRFTTHELPAMRQAIIPCLRRLQIYPEFIARLIDLLLPVLLAPEPFEGLHSFISQLLQTDLPNWMEAANQDTAWMLLNGSASSSQELGGKLLQINANRWVESLTTKQIAELTHHEILMVRTAGWQLLDRILSRLRQNSADLLAATVVMASKWADARTYGFRLFGETLQPGDLTPAIVISICDSNREDVRRFGRDLVSKCFRAEDGLEYLLKFSEHPTADMQLFASQYLEDYAADHPDRLAELTPYFGRVLGQVNRSRVAKERIFNFLRSEATKSATAAQLVVEVLTRQAGSIAINERAKSLETLLKIHQQYPELTVPIKVKEVAIK